MLKNIKCVFIIRGSFIDPEEEGEKELFAFWKKNFMKYLSEIITVPFLVTFAGDTYWISFTAN